jgi:hypothetical protein
MSEAKERCTCCGKLLTAKTRCEHRRLYLEQVARSLVDNPNTGPVEFLPAYDVPAAGGLDVPTVEEDNEFEGEYLLE